MPELPWVKWYPQLWLSEPGLQECDHITKSIWSDVLNIMLQEDTHVYRSTLSKMAIRFRCTQIQMMAALEDLKQCKICEVEMLHSLHVTDTVTGSVTLICRRLYREHNERNRIRLAVRKHRTKKSVTENVTGCNSTSTSIQKGVQGEGIPPFDEEWRWARTLLADWQKNGADYRESELKHALNQCRANGWMWGKNSVVDKRSALEAKIQDQRDRKAKTETRRKGPNI